MNGFHFGLEYGLLLGTYKTLFLVMQDFDLPVVHSIRDPVQILISAYLYHQQDPPNEPWLADPKPDAMNGLPKEFRKKYGKVPYYKVCSANHISF